MRFLDFAGIAICTVISIVMQKAQAGSGSALVALIPYVLVEVIDETKRFKSSLAISRRY